MLDETKDKVNEAHYYKEKEHVCANFSEAQVLADELFEPFLIGAAGGERTCAQAKVRIRCKAGNDTSRDHFKVVLYKNIKLSDTKTQGPSNSDTDSIEDDLTDTDTESGRTKEARPRRKGKERRSNGKTKSQ